MTRAFKISFRVLVYIFAVIGFVLVAGFFAVKFNLTKVSGETDQNNTEYGALQDKLSDLNANKNSNDLYQKETDEKKLLCQIDVLADYSPVNAKYVLTNYLATYNQSVSLKMLLALQIRINNPEYKASLDSCQNKDKYESISASKIETKITSSSNKPNIFPWVSEEEWPTVTAGILKDKDLIITTGKSAGIDPRLIVASCMVEQMRLYHTDREKYEKIFKPLNILGNYNDMAWGVMAIKEKTAITIEQNLKDPASAYYPGKEYENLLDFKTDDQAKERFDRLTDDKNHIYAYLYGAVYLKEYLSQWKKAGFPIDDRPEIIATLFNLGFEHSTPKANPEVGGTIIEMDSSKYTFGSLAYEFYYSGEMSDDFPITQ